MMQKSTKALEPFTTGSWTWTNTNTEALEVREGCRKSKWKFKMAFAMRGGGLEGVSFAIKLF